MVRNLGPCVLSRNIVADLSQISSGNEIMYLVILKAADTFTAGYPSSAGTVLFLFFKVKQEKHLAKKQIIIDAHQLIRFTKK